MAVRNHVNHASEEENKDSVDGLFQKDDIKKIVGINSEISTMQALLDNMELVKSVIDNLLSNADEYQKAFEQVKDLKSKTGDA